MMGYSPLVFSMVSGSHIRRIPAESPLATLKPLGANRATVVGWVWPVYALQSAGLSIERTKMDLPDYGRTSMLVCQNTRVMSNKGPWSNRVDYPLALRVRG